TEGRYSIVDLRPGTYAVTFTLTGFSTVRREGIDLPGGFTATVNVDLRVGALEETITVSGAAPLVDTQNVKQQQRVTADMLDALPISTKALGNTFSTLVPALSAGAALTATPVASSLWRSTGVSTQGSFHAKLGGKDMYDGMSYINLNGST